MVALLEHDDIDVQTLAAAGLTPDEVEAFNKVCDKVSLHRNQAGKPPTGVRRGRSRLALLRHRVADG